MQHKQTDLSRLEDGGEGDNGYQNYEHVPFPIPDRGLEVGRVRFIHFECYVGINLPTQTTLEPKLGLVYHIYTFDILILHAFGISAHFLLWTFHSRFQGI